MSPPMHSGQMQMPLASMEELPVVQPQQRAWLEIDREAISHNTAQICHSLKPGCSLMAVVKADGYGHGAVTVAEAAADGGATSFGVATLAEGIELRQAAITAPVLVLGNLQHSAWASEALNVNVWTLRSKTSLASKMLGHVRYLIDW